MPVELYCHRLEYSYHVLDMHDIDCSELLDSNNPDALVLAILCDFGERAPQEIIERILLALRHIYRDDLVNLRDRLLALEVLAANRNLLPILKETLIKSTVTANCGNPFHCGFPMRCSKSSHMSEYAAVSALGKPFIWLASVALYSPQRFTQSLLKQSESEMLNVDIESLPSYQIGWEKGEAMGINKGEAIGISKGEARLVRALLRKQSPEAVAELTSMELSRVLAIAADGQS